VCVPILRFDPDQGCCYRIVVIESTTEELNDYEQPPDGETKDHRHPNGA
jgi:hypothetical protein